MSDSSLHPDYSKYEVPYWVICRERYAAARRKHDQQLLYELRMHEAMQSSAYEAMRFHRHFVITTLWPPLHTAKEIRYVLTQMYKLPERQRRRLNELLHNIQT